MLEEVSLAGKKGGLRMKKRAVIFAVTLGLSVFAFGSGPAAADESGNAAINCAGFGNPGQTFQAIGGQGQDRTGQTPPEGAHQLGFPTLGAALQFYCTTPAG
jgi:hypothetical protein